MPVNVVKTRADERLWERAKAQATKQGHAGNYPYIMSIFQTMRGNPGASLAEIQRVLDAVKADLEAENETALLDYFNEQIAHFTDFTAKQLAKTSPPVRPPFEIQAREIDSYEDFARLYREAWVMVKKYGGQVGAQLGLEHMALLADLYPEWEAKFEDAQGYGASPVTAVVPIVPTAAPPAVIDPPDSAAVREAKDNVLEWATQLAALPPPSVEDFMGFSAATDRPMRTFLGKVGSRPVPLEDWLRASRLLIIHSRTQLPRAGVMKAVRAFERAVFEKHLAHYNKQRDPDFPILEEDSYEPLSDDFNIVDEEEGQAVETGFGTVKWTWGGGDTVEFALPKKMGRENIVRDKLVDQGYIAAIKGYATGGSYRGRPQKVWRLVLHLHGVPALIEMIRKAGGNLAARRLQAALASWVLARPEAMNKPRQRPTEQEKEDRTLRVRKPRNAGGWWNVYWHPPNVPKQEYGWNASEKRWARRKVPPYEIIQKLQKKHPEGGWGTGGETFKVEGVGYVFYTPPSAKKWYGVFVESAEEDPEHPWDNYSYKPGSGWWDQNEPRPRVQAALAEKAPNIFRPPF